MNPDKISAPPDADAQKVLDITSLTMSFGGLRAVDSVDLDVKEGEIVALIGPNGAGKTTFFNCITGIYPPDSGDIDLIPKGGKPERLNGMKPNKITSRGMARTFQNIRLFHNMTALENIMVGRHCRTKAGILGAILRGPRTRREERDIVTSSYTLLHNVGLGDFVNEQAKNLPYGAQRRLEIARALATDPFLLLLDEPAAGMNPQETEKLMELIESIRKSGVSILLIEHDMKLIMRISDRILVLDHGLKIAEGNPAEIRSNQSVIEAYLGSSQVAN
ncbi:MAG: ABC transporter ATP-binding protein [bacterium]|nr:ABC transporter ATP-binding protein [bacterium]MDT8366166.1 ABC transporter ATP-binding protein [bacterium]